MIVVPKPTPIPIRPNYHTQMMHHHHHQLPQPSYPPARLARARNANPISLAPIPISTNGSSFHPALDSPIDLSSPSPSPSPVTPRTPPRRNNNNNNHRKSPSKRPSYHHHNSLSHGGDFDMALDLSDMMHQQQLQFQQAAAATSSASSSPVTPPRTPTSPFQFPYHHAHAQSAPTVGSSFPASYFPINNHSPFPTTPTRPTHVRSPSAPTFGHTGGDRYANSGFQNSPPPRAIPKPKFL